MPRVLSTTGVASLIFAGLFAAPLPVAQAQDLQLRIGPNGITPEFRHDEDRGRRDHHRRRGCDLSEARDLARQYGLHRPEVARVTERSVVIEGMTRHGRERMRFANVPGCPER